MKKIQFKILIPEDLLPKIEASAQSSMRSRASEIVFALNSYYEQKREVRP